MSDVGFVFSDTDHLILIEFIHYEILWKVLITIAICKYCAEISSQ